MTKKQKLSKTPRAYRMRAMMAILDALEAYYGAPVVSEENVRCVVEAAMTAKFGGYSLVKR